MLTFSVHGIPQPAGSKRAFPFQKANGSLGVRVTDANPKARSWKQDVATTALAKRNGAELLSGPLILTVTFYLPRPKGHLGARGLRPSAPRFPTVKPDATKLLRGLEDALSGVLWNDDAQVVVQNVAKVYCGPADSPRTDVTVEEVP